MSRTLVDRLSRPALRVLAALLACTSLAGAHAQDDYPARTVSMLVPFPPGGVGMSQAAKARPDGYTVLVVRAGSPIQFLDQPEFDRYVQAESRVMAGAVKRIGPAE